MSASASAAAASPSPDTYSSGNSPSQPTGPLASVANALTTLFPVWVVGAAIWGLARPTAFAWFRPDYTTPALAITMLGMGLTLTFDVSY